MIYYPPLLVMPDIPVGNHFGSFGVERKYDYHTGVDLYCEKGDIVRAIEPGVVTEINWFTGTKLGLPWWNDTRCVCVEGNSGVIVYGEMQEFDNIKVGSKITRGLPLGEIKTVLKKDKGKPMNMLHLMLLKHGTKEANIVSWLHGSDIPEGLMDPTNMLIQCQMNYSLILHMSIMKKDTRHIRDIFFKYGLEDQKGA